MASSATSAARGGIDLGGTKIEAVVVNARSVAVGDICRASLLLRSSFLACSLVNVAPSAQCGTDPLSRAL